MGMRHITADNCWNCSADPCICGGSWYLHSTTASDAAGSIFGYAPHTLSYAFGYDGSVGGGGSVTDNVNAESAAAAAPAAAPADDDAEVEPELVAIAANDLSDSKDSGDSKGDGREALVEDVASAVETVTQEQLNGVLRRLLLDNDISSAAQPTTEDIESVLAQIREAREQTFLLRSARLMHHGHATKTAHEFFDCLDPTRTSDKQFDQRFPSASDPGPQTPGRIKTLDVDDKDEDVIPVTAEPDVDGVPAAAAAATAADGTAAVTNGGWAPPTEPASTAAALPPAPQSAAAAVASD